jgi:hypothetical protein
MNQMPYRQIRRSTREENDAAVKMHEVPAYNVARPVAVLL